MAVSASRTSRQRGLTLIEVMVALAVLAIALAAVVQSVGESTSNVSRMRERTFATWIADNVIAELQISRAWATGKREETRRFAGREWPVEIEIQETQFPAVRRVDVDVMRPADADATAATMRSLVVDPALKAG